MTRRIITSIDKSLYEIILRTVPRVAHGFASELDEPPPQRPKAPKTDDYSSRLLKLIPADVVAVFVTIDGIIKSSAENSIPSVVYWIIFAFLLVGTYFYTIYISKLPMLPSAHLQATISTASFAVWVFALGGPFLYAKLSWYLPVYGALLLPLYTFFVPILFAVIKDKKGGD